MRSPFFTFALMTAENVASQGKTARAASFRRGQRATGHYIPDRQNLDRFSQAQFGAEIGIA
jgi:hypothetical protein